MPEKPAEAADMRDERHESRRQQVLTAAAECFVKHGFNGASMSVIARTAGMSVGHIYHYFKNKDDIIASIVTHANDEALEKIAELRNLPAETFIESLVQYAEIGIQTRTDVFRTALTTEILAESRRSPRISEIVVQSDRRFRQVFADIIRSKTGLDDAEARIEALSTIYSGLGERMTRNPSLDAAAILPHIQAAIRAIFS